MACLHGLISRGIRVQSRDKSGLVWSIWERVSGECYFEVMNLACLESPEKDIVALQLGNGEVMRVPGQGWECGVIYGTPVPG